jgi:hypothetical protein
MTNKSAGQGPSSIEVKHTYTGFSGHRPEQIFAKKTKSSMLLQTYTAKGIRITTSALHFSPVPFLPEI